MPDVVIKIALILSRNAVVGSDILRYRRNKCRTAVFSNNIQQNYNMGQKVTPFWYLRFLPC